MTQNGRYSRQEILLEIGEKGQGLLAKSRIAVIGVGATGTTAANLLARAGIGKIAIIDRDIIELHNLQRQDIFIEQDCNKPKAIQAKKYLKEVNNNIDIDAYPIEINHETISILNDFELVLDCTDNMETRFLINDFCVKNKKPWIFCSATGTKGMVLSMTNETPCFRCLFSLPSPGALETCDTVGILNTITTAVAAIQVTEAIKILTKQEYTKELIRFDIWKSIIERIDVKKKKDCICCQRKIFEFLDGKELTQTITFCGQERVQIKGRKPYMKEIERRLRKSGKCTVTEYGMHFVSQDADFFLFQDGRCLIKAKKKQDAMTVYRKYIGN